MSKKKIGINRTFFGIMLFALIALIIIFWKIILCLALISGIVWLTYVYRRPIWSALTQSWNWICIHCKEMNANRLHKKGPNAAGHYTNKYGSYGKINQYH